MVAFPGITKDHYALPPRGITASKATCNGEPIYQWTYLCEIEGCFAVGYSKKSSDDARRAVAEHACPAPMRRGMLPMGKSLLEKMWDESDDALDALKDDTFYLTEELRDEKLKGYIAGIAECISFCAMPYFRITEDVLREMNRRWKMRQGTIPFSPTPSYRYNPPLTESVPAPAIVRQAPTKTVKPTKRAAAAPHPVLRVFTEEERCLIVNSHAGGMGVSVEDLAKMFDVNVSRIEYIIDGPKTQEVILPDLF